MLDLSNGVYIIRFAHVEAPGSDVNVFHQGVIVSCENPAGYEARRIIANEELTSQEIERIEAFPVDPEIDELLLDDDDLTADEIARISSFPVDPEIDDLLEGSSGP